MESPGLPTGDCFEARQLISVRLDSELSALDEVLLETHLVVCPGCREHATKLAALTSELRSAALVVPKLSVAIPARRRRYWRLNGMSAAAATAVAAAVAIVALSAGGGSFTSRTVAVAGPPLYQQLKLKEQQMNALASAPTSTQRPADAPSGPDPSVGP